jgi:hypothetical protein
MDSAARQTAPDANETPTGSLLETLPMNSSLLALLAVVTLGVCLSAASADDVLQVVPLPVPQAPGTVTETPVAPPASPQGSAFIPRDGKWNRGMIANDGAQFSGAAPYSAPYIGGTWEGPIHIRYPYYSYRRNWDYAGPASLNVTIVW